MKATIDLEQLINEAPPEIMAYVLESIDPVENQNVCSWLHENFCRNGQLDTFYKVSESRRKLLHQMYENSPRSRWVLINLIGGETTTVKAIALLEEACKSGQISLIAYVLTVADYHNYINARKVIDALPREFAWATSPSAGVIIDVVRKYADGLHELHGRT
jgi:hypothetical protein